MLEIYNRWNKHIGHHGEKKKKDLNPYGDGWMKLRSTRENSKWTNSQSPWWRLAKTDKN